MFFENIQWVTDSVIKWAYAQKVIFDHSYPFNDQICAIFRSFLDKYTIQVNGKDGSMTNDHLWSAYLTVFPKRLQKGEKQSVFNAYQYLLKCNPYIKGVPVHADRPLLKENPQIKYGSSLKKGTVHIN